MVQGSTTVAAVVLTVVAVPLWNVEHVLWFWTVQDSSIYRPQSTEDPEQRTLPTAIWTRDQHIHALVHLRHREKIQAVKAKLGKADSSTVASATSGTEQLKRRKNRKKK